VGVSRAAGAEKPSAPAAGVLAAFYAVLMALAMIGLEGWLLVLPVLAVYLVILRNLVRLSRSLEDTGYAIHAAPVRLSMAAVLWGYLGVTLAAVILAMLLGQRYPMDWQVRDDAPQDAAIRAEVAAQRADGVTQTGKDYADMEGLCYKMAFNYEMAKHPDPFTEAKGYNGPVLLLRADDDRLVDEGTCSRYAQVYTAPDVDTIAGGGHNFATLAARAAVEEKTAAFIKANL
jgi:pimeloyl-ACP methyl ester carboxylesterase